MNGIGQDYKVFWWYVTEMDLPSAPTNAKVMSLDYSKVPELFAALNDGYAPVSHNVLPKDGGVLLSVLLARPISVPETAEA